jgi:hypothetical protein
LTAAKRSRPPIGEPHPDDLCATCPSRLSKRLQFVDKGYRVDNCVRSVY